MPAQRTTPDGNSVLESLRRERDKALEALAEEREKLNALQVALRVNALPAHPDADLGDAATPLRHVLVDRLNDRVKTALRPVHDLSRWLAKNVVKPAR